MTGGGMRSTGQKLAWTVMEERVECLKGAEMWVREQSAVGRAWQPQHSTELTGTGPKINLQGWAEVRGGSLESNVVNRKSKDRGRRAERSRPFEKVEVEEPFWEAPANKTKAKPSFRMNLVSSSRLTVSGYGLSGSFSLAFPYSIPLYYMPLYMRADFLSYFVLWV